MRFLNVTANCCVVLTATSGRASVFSVGRGRPSSRRRDRVWIPRKEATMIGAGTSLRPDRQKARDMLLADSDPDRR